MWYALTDEYSTFQIYTHVIYVCVCIKCQIYLTCNFVYIINEMMVIGFVLSENKKNVSQLYLKVRLTSDYIS